MAVHPKQQVISDFQDFTKHLEGIADQVQSAAIVVDGLNSHLAHDKAEAIGEH
jgi:hypothetical protein